MNTPAENDSSNLPIFEPKTDATYALDVVVEMTGLSSQTILRYREQGLIAPVTDRESGADCFNDEALRTLRRLEHLRTSCEMNESGLKLVLSLLEEVERLGTSLRSRR